MCGLLLAASAARGEEPTHAELAETALRRPLFTEGRRPPAPPKSAPIAAPAPVPLPRLTGIMMFDATRHAVFTRNDGRPAVVREGDRIGDYRVTAIAIGRVELEGPAGRHVLGLQADPANRTDTAATPPVIALMDPYRRERETENDQ